MINENSMNNFKLVVHELWYAELDGYPVAGAKMIGFTSKRSATASITLKLNDYCNFYGFINGSEMRKYLEETGRLKIKKVNNDNRINK